MTYTNYQRGARREAYLREIFESDGWHVIRSAGSHTLFDLVCVKDGLVVFVQSKSKKSETLLHEYKRFAVSEGQYVILTWKYLSVIEGALITPNGQVSVELLADLLTILDNYTEISRATFLIHSPDSNTIGSA